MTTQETETDTHDRVESLLERQAETIERQEQVIQELRETVADQQETIEALETETTGGLPISRRGALKAGGVLAALGIGGAGTASAAPQGQIGTSTDPLATLYADTLAGPLTGGSSVDSLVGEGLTVTGGELTVALDLPELSVTAFSMPDTESGQSYTVDVTVEETAGLQTSGLNVSLVVTDADGNEVYDETITPSSELENGSTTVTFGVDDGTPQLGFSTGDYTATATADASNTVAGTATDSVAVVDRFAGGSGTSADPYQVANWIHLDNVRDEPDKEFIQVADINETTAGYDSIASASANGGKGFDPIGSLKFTGEFDGNGYAITGLTIDRDRGTDSTGLFAANTGTLANVTLEQVTISDDGQYVGSLVGGNAGSVRNSSATGSVSGDSEVGGLVGRMYSDSGDPPSVTDSYASVDVSGTSSLGGLVGQCGDSFYGPGEVSNSYATGNVTGTNSAVGGLVGGYYNNSSTIEQSYATGSVSGGSDVGGLIGLFDSGTVAGSYWDTESTGQDTSAGSTTGLTTSEMQGGEAEATMGDFDFSLVWATVDADNDADVSADDYPVLQALDRAEQLEARS